MAAKKEPVMKEKSFEENIARLEEIVGLLERGDAPLQGSLDLFEEGAGLVSACTRLLEQAEQKVVKLQKGPDGAPEELPCAEEE